jgi:hypothetical protein
MQGIAVAAFAVALLAPTPGSARINADDCEAARRSVQADLDAACPCDGGTMHGDYVRCVTKKLRELSACAPGTDGKRSCGPLSRLCERTIRRGASRSACGKSADTVTCCIPKQQDCVGDSAPGDGKKDGTCSGSKRTCDRITECMIPRCEVSPNAEVCRTIGGTPGNGRDCTRACAE